MTVIHPTIIAIDGTAASGKGTIARMLAAHLDFARLDTGLLYRAVGVAVLEAGKDPADPAAAQTAAEALDPVALTALTDDKKLRTHAAGEAASKVAAIWPVRAALLKFQQDFCANPPGGKKGAVLDGRDIGTAIAPDAVVKIFVDARPEVRAARRAKELRERGENVSETAVLADMRVRDARDTGRAVVPLKPAPDALLLDTSDLTVDQSFAAALAIVREKTGLG